MMFWGYFILSSPSEDNSENKSIETNISAKVDTSKKTTESILKNTGENSTNLSGVSAGGNININKEVELKTETKKKNFYFIDIEGKIVDVDNVRYGIPDVMIHFTDKSKVRREFTDRYGDFKMLSNVEFKKKNNIEIEISAIGYITEIKYIDIDNKEIFLDMKKAP